MSKSRQSDHLDLFTSKRIILIIPWREFHVSSSVVVYMLIFPMEGEPAFLV